MAGKESIVGKTLARNWWNLERFGFSPYKLRHRLANRNEPRVLCVSIPKAGTHLLERALCLHPRLYRKLMPTLNDTNIHKWEGELDQLLTQLCPGQIIVSHIRFTNQRLRAIENSGVRGVFLIRDPRDIAVSQAFYIARNHNHPLHNVFLAQTDLKARIRVAIEGYSPGGLPSIGQRLLNYAGWLDSGCLVVRFEDLIGSRGNGDRGSQHRALHSVYEFIELEVSGKWLDLCSQHLFTSASPTFRKGKLGQWKAYFDEELKEVFKEVAGEELVRYEYERDNSW